MRLKNDNNGEYSEEIGALAESLKIFQKYKVINSLLYKIIITIVKPR